MMTIDDQIRSIARRLKLPAIADYRQHLEADPQSPFSETLLQLLQAKLAGRQKRSFARRVKQARFPDVKTLDTFVPDRLPHLSPDKIRQLATCDYIHDHYHILAIDNSGTGKTHLAKALGIQAARLGFSVRFHMVLPLIDQLLEARNNRDLRLQTRPLETCDLLILDEFGYQHLSGPQASMLFQLFAARHKPESTCVTTNLEFSKWADILGDHILAAALVDRFAQKSVLLNMNGPSFRLTEGREATKKKERPPQTPS